MDKKSGVISEILNEPNQIDHLMEKMEPFRRLMMQYQCAILEVKTKLEVLNEELTLQNNINPFESIKTRLKKPESILKKMKKQRLSVTVDNIEKNLHDIAGIRVICSFPDDIYTLVDCISKQDDIIVCEKKDYIANPKPNGYRSLHLILEVPIFLTAEKKYMKVEVQFRTIAMDFWASLEHKVKYKKDIKNSDEISKELKQCADIISLIDQRMQQIKYEITENNDVKS
ncbi:MAG TPA: GTP pyrophosphokinase family protein [Firmicutes bacterium]|nr:GTP pyrophosphokinase family protein [Bacillales bacterium]HJA41093.1 GTP pyrophosphokinase family protein [Bacillota bacterium]